MGWQRLYLSKDGRGPCTTTPPFMRFAARIAESSARVEARQSHAPWDASNEIM